MRTFETVTDSKERRYNGTGVEYWGPLRVNCRAHQIVWMRILIRIDHGRLSTPRISPSSSIKSSEESFRCMRAPLRALSSGEDILVDTCCCPNVIMFFQLSWLTILCPVSKLDRQGITTLSKLLPLLALVFSLLLTLQEHELFSVPCYVLVPILPPNYISGFLWVGCTVFVC